jgi:hypothetical protein
LASMAFDCCYQRIFSEHCGLAMRGEDVTSCAFRVCFPPEQANMWLVFKMAPKCFVCLFILNLYAN